MLTTVALIGMFALFGLAVVIGLVDSGSQRSAWNRIAAARKEIFEDRRAIHDQVVDLRIRTERLKLREHALRAREEAVALRERRLPPEDDGPEGIPAA
jgi:hypothetical protein